VTKIEPALRTSDAAEWAYYPPPGKAVQEWPTHTRHQLAAIALYGQPFGFTWEDVDLLRDYGSYFDDGAERNIDELHSLAARIAALLPPREEVRL
jgi:hypothetical protein